MKKVILEGPFQTPTITIPGDANAVPPGEATVTPVPDSQFTADQLLYREANELAMEYILQGIPNPIFRSIDAQKTAKDMWEHVHLLMEGT